MHAQISGKVGESDANVLKMQCNAELMPAYGWTTNMVYRKSCFLFVYLNIVSLFLSTVTDQLIESPVKSWNLALWLSPFNQIMRLWEITMC